MLTYSKISDQGVIQLVENVGKLCFYSKMAVFSQSVV